MRDLNDLATYLMGRLPEGLSYSDAAQLCLRLYSTVDGVPEELCPLNRDRLGDAFARLAKAGWVRSEQMWYASFYGATFHQVTEKGHWIEIMASIGKKGPQVVDMAQGEALARKAGFVKGIGP